MTTPITGSHSRTSCPADDEKILADKFSKMNISKTKGDRCVLDPSKTKERRHTFERPLWPSDAVNPYLRKLYKVVFGKSSLTASLQIPISSKKIELNTATSLLEKETLSQNARMEWRT